MIADPNPIAAAQLRFRRPLVDVLTASAALDIGRKEVMNLVESGELRWAFDLSQGNRQQRAVRILVKSIEDYQQRATAPAVSQEQEFRNVLKLILPGGRSRAGVVLTVRAADLARRLGVDSDTVLIWMRAAELQCARRAPARCGPHGSPEITVASVKTFLLKRRVA